ncbi:hypothetical protein D8X55_05075, partial [Malacoplasma penetrans]
IVSSCSSTSDNNTGGGNNGGDTQTQKVSLQLKDSVDLKGSLSKIFDTEATNASSRKSTNTLISEDIKANPGTYFTFTETTEETVKETIQNATVEVEGNFSSSSWEGQAYNQESGNWGADSSVVTIDPANKYLYPTNLDQLTFKDLDGLKTELEKTGTNNKTVLQNALETAGATIDAGAQLSIENRLGLTNDDLLHVNVKETKANTADKNYDLQIPVSDLNLSVSDLSIKVTSDNIETGEKTTTKYDYNIGIDPTTHYVQGTTKPSANDEASVDVNKVLEDLSLATDANGTLDNEALIKALGVYNVQFSNPTIAKKATTTRAIEDTVYTITLKATPTANKNYVWSDNGNSEERDITFDVTLAIGTN